MARKKKAPALEPCEACGQNVSSMARKCPGCGHPTKRGRYVSPHNRTLTALVCLFLGVFGVHHFYVGRPFAGILYFFTAGLFGFGVVVDLFLIVVGQFTDGKGRTLM